MTTSYEEPLMTSTKISEITVAETVPTEIVESIIHETISIVTLETTVPVETPIKITICIPIQPEKSYSLSF
ncbi:hypothetical protein PIROE2DRAFT_7648 [Piromyces sp. E2]|nr:hypothetical protein PIROE2DRAFT_7648 [Piromyces sp. E2]|eukprot:OUM65349.1 hypothetical protein PIROE2DRAFT_7648 [Piromyces sp. E2]